MSARDWTPVRNGDTLCSPACGGGCTVAAHDKAEKAAASLAFELGPDWRPRVWENLGWHYSAVLGPPPGLLKVHVHGGKWFTAFLSYEPSPGGQWTFSATDPREAVDAAVAKARADAEGIRVMLEAVGW